LGAGTLCGALWWTLGGGRPEGPASGSPLGLWAVDGAGILFWVIGAVLIFTLGFDRLLSRFGRAVVALLSLIGLVVAQSTVTVSGLWSTHLLILLPLPQVTVAAFLVAGGRWLADRLASREVVTGPPAAARLLPIALTVALLVSLDLIVDYSYHRDLTLTGGGSTFSDAIYSLADYLDAERQKPQVVAMDWGFRRPLQFLTHERIDPSEPFWSEPPEFRRAMAEKLDEPNTLYLFHTAEGSRYKLFDQFKAEASAAGKEIKLERTFYHRDGVPVYEVYSAK
jgi:hypothetical protein